MKILALIKVATKLQEKDLSDDTKYRKFMKNVLLDRLKNKKGMLTRNEKMLAKHLELDPSSIEPTSLGKRFITSRLGAGITSGAVTGIGWGPGALAMHLMRQEYAANNLRKVKKDK